MPPIVSSNTTQPNQNVELGERWIWASGSVVSFTLLLTFTLLWLIVVNALGYFWPKALTQMQLKEGPILGLVVEKETTLEGRKRWKLQVGNRDLGGDPFRWVFPDEATRIHTPTIAVALERQEFGNFYGFLRSVSSPARGVEQKGKEPKNIKEQQTANWKNLQQALIWAQRERQKQKALYQQVETTGQRIQALKRQQKRTNFGLQQRQALAQSEAQFDQETQALVRLQAQNIQRTATFFTVQNKTLTLPVIHIVRAWQPNAMSLTQKISFYGAKVWEVLSTSPREANTEGGLFPAIFGTVLMVILMSLFCLPLGVGAAVYLHEYAKDNWWTRLVRIAVYNLAGAPSIVFGIFGLGFFVYGLGGSIDRVFFAERLPTPTFGTGGLLWASLTLALLTVPVVIVSTEEGLASAQRSMREASYALGGAKFQTLARVIFPMATPGILTGLVLAVARAAGETAPLMLTGVVKLAPDLAIDGQFPFVHLDRKFMHLGFHIFDLGFQSPNAEAAKPMVYVTALLLLLIVVGLSVGALGLRSRMRTKNMGRAF